MEIINFPEITFIGKTLTGKKIEKIVRTIGDLKGFFADEKTFNKLETNQIVYEVESYLPVKEGTTGGLFFGITHIHPGNVSNEYYMTKGHAHLIEDRAEYYWGIEGEGVLLLMDKERNTWGEHMYPGSLHYINGHTAHRVANAGSTVLSFGACWPSDAGHNYELIAKDGFSKRLMNVDGNPQLV